MYTECNNNELKLVVRRTDWSTSDLLYLFAEFYLFKSYVFFYMHKNKSPHAENQSYYFNQIQIAFL